MGGCRQGATVHSCDSEFEEGGGGIGGGEEGGRGGGGGEVGGVVGPVVC